MGDEKPELKIVSLSERRDRDAIPATEVERAVEAEATGDEEQIDGLEPFDLADAIHRAEAFSGALSTLDYVQCEPRDFMALMSREPPGVRALYRAKAVNARNKLDAIIRAMTEP